MKVYFVDVLFCLLGFIYAINGQSEAFLLVLIFLELRMQSKEKLYREKCQ